MSFFANCPHGKLIVAGIYAVLSTIFLLTTILGTLRYIIYYKQNPKERPPKSLFIIGLLHLFISVCTLTAYLSNSMHQTLTCFEWSYPIYYIHMAFYCLQTYSLWLILFLRLYYVFLESIHKVSKFTIYFLTFIFITLAIVVLLIFMPFFETSVRWILYVICFLFAICLSCGISILFIYKLHIVYKSMIHNIIDDDLLSIITKNTVLVVISISFTIGNVIQVVLTIHQWDFVSSRVRNFIFLCDAYTNFVTIMFTYQFFDKHYHTLCGWIDNKCKIFCHCCTKLISNKTVKDIQMVHTSNNSGSSTCTTTTATANTPSNTTVVASV